MQDRHDIEALTLERAVRTPQRLHAPDKTDWMRAGSACSLGSDKQSTAPPHYTC